MVDRFFLLLWRFTTTHNELPGEQDRVTIADVVVYGPPPSEDLIRFLLVPRERFYKESQVGNSGEYVKGWGVIVAQEATDGGFLVFFNKTEAEIYDRTPGDDPSRKAFAGGLIDVLKARKTLGVNCTLHGRAISAVVDGYGKFVVSTACLPDEQSILTLTLDPEFYTITCKGENTSIAEVGSYCRADYIWIKEQLYWYFDNTGRAQLYNNNYRGGHPVNKPAARESWNLTDVIIKTLKPTAEDGKAEICDGVLWSNYAGHPLTAWHTLP